MNFLISKAETKDIPDIAKVHVETWQSHYRGQVPDDYLDRLSVEKRIKTWTDVLSHPKQKSATFVAESDGRAVGFCSVGPSKDKDAAIEIGELYAIYLDHKKQGLGIGSALMKAGIDFLRDQGFKKATLWVLKTNKKTISFYESKGWKADGSEMKDEKDGFVFEETRYGIAL